MSVRRTVGRLAAPEPGWSVRVDVTSTAMPPMGHGTGDIGAREGGVVAGLGVAALEGARARVLHTRKTLPTYRALHSVKVFDLGLDLR